MVPKLPARLDESLLAPLGRMVANANALEYYLAFALYLVDAPGKTQWELQALVARKKLDELHVAVRRRLAAVLDDAALRAAWEAIDRRIAVVAARREALLHCTWSPDLAARLSRERLASASPGPTSGAALYVGVTAEALEGAAGEIAEVTHELAGLLPALGAAVRGRRAQATRSADPAPAAPPPFRPIRARAASLAARLRRKK